MGYVTTFAGLPKIILIVMSAIVMSATAHADSVDDMINMLDDMDRSSRDTQRTINYYERQSQMNAMDRAIKQRNLREIQYQQEKQRQYELERAIMGQ